MSDDLRRLYGELDDEYLSRDEEEAATEAFEHRQPPVDATYPHTATVEICEYAVLPPGDFGGDRMPTASWLIERMVEGFEDLAFEELHGSIEAAGKDPEVVTAFQAALDLMESKIGFWLAGKRLGSRLWSATIQADGGDWTNIRPDEPASVRNLEGTGL